MSNGDNDPGDGSGKFLSRWSRLKREAKAVEPDGVRQSAQVDRTGATAPLQRRENEVNGESEPPQLPPLDELTLDSDYKGFFHPKVGEDVKRAALKKLFSDPHFNVMDGLDTYIDDYSISEPIPAEMLAQMRSAQKIFKWARNELEEGETAPAQLPPAPPTVPAATAVTDDAALLIEPAADESLPQQSADATDTPVPETDEKH